MTELYLKKTGDDWTLVHIDGSQPFKLTRENPYFTQSENYTLDVTLPMDILENRQFFRNLQRKDAGKRYTEYACRLMVNNIMVMDGTAHITQVTQDAVKVQLSTGVSALKMTAAQEGLYIDEMDLGAEAPSQVLTTRLDSGETTGGFYPIFHDTNNDVAVNLCSADTLLGARYAPYRSECPTLLGLAAAIALELGYHLDVSCLPAACSNIYVVSGAQYRLSRKLPHWTVKEFLQEFQNFFGCIFLSTGGKNLRLAPLSSFDENSEVMIEPVEEYTSDFSDDDEAGGIINSNIEYSMENSDTETVSDEILAQAQYDVTYGSRPAMDNAFQSDSVAVKTHKIYRYAGHIYMAWKRDDQGNYGLECVAPFNPLTRFPDAEHKSLKIVPAYMEKDAEMNVFDYLGGSDGRTVPVVLNIPAVSNPYSLVNSVVDSGGDTVAPSMQALVEGTESVVTEDDKPDVMNVAFIDGLTETVTVTKDVNDDTLPTPFVSDVCLAFTDYDFKTQLTNNHRRWSFSLNPLDGYEFHLGQLHVLDFECNRKVRHVFQFLADQMPDPTNIFIIDNRRYGCEKIEASVNEEGFDRLMTGYFYEMTP